MNVKHRIGITQRNKDYVTRKDIVDMVGEDYKKLIYQVSGNLELGWPYPAPSKTAVKLYLKTSVLKWFERNNINVLLRDYKSQPTVSVNKLEEGISTLDNVMAQKYIRTFPLANI
jgi:hypothetical protein